MQQKILIVDDNPNMSSLLSEMLEVFDHESVRAADGNEALTELEAGNFSIVISDMRMPNMSGLELLREVKSRFPKVRVVLISGFANGAEEARAEGLAPDGFLGKPLMMSDVEKMLNSLL